MSFTIDHIDPGYAILTDMMARANSRNIYLPFSEEFKEYVTNSVGLLKFAGEQIPDDVLDQLLIKAAEFENEYAYGVLNNKNKDVIIGEYYDERSQERFNCR